MGKLWLYYNSISRRKISEKVDKTKSWTQVNRAGCASLNIQLGKEEMKTSEPIIKFVSLPFENVSGALVENVGVTQKLYFCIAELCSEYTLYVYYEFWKICFSSSRQEIRIISFQFIIRHSSYHKRWVLFNMERMLNNVIK